VRAVALTRAKNSTARLPNGEEQAMTTILGMAEAQRKLFEHIARGDTTPLYVELPRPVGADILNTVSSDLYKDPFHVLRELIQNSYDENAENVDVLVTGGCLTVKDDGRGMDWGSLLGARRLSGSEKVYNPEKYPNPVRGFRKLGIYSGYQIAQRFELRTKRAGDEFELTVTFDFAKMRAEVSQNRGRREEERWDFKQLVEHCTYVTGQKVDRRQIPVTDSYTIAQLVNVDGTDAAAWAKLSDVQGLAKYIVQTFSLDFDKAFVHRTKINAHLKSNVPGFHPFTIKLITADGEQALKRPAITDVDEVKFVRVPKNARQPLAIGWIGRRKDRALEDPSARGIAFKVGGITIGRRVAEREGASSDHYYFYDRLTGEFHVIDEDIKPDPERADFNPSPKTDQLRVACNAIVNDIVSDAREDRKVSTEQTKAEKKAKKLIAQWTSLKEKLDSPPQNKEQLLGVASEIAIALKELKSAQVAVSGQLAAEATKNIQEVEATVTSVTKNRRPGRRWVPIIRMGGL
jgi:hypothetical protein